jgi:meso-butanediol dehydrogenase/(S,S)-butanediol dehydrogenase/diacetyl reductase
MILQGKSALVTGGGRGLGRGIAMRLAQAGADVAVADINPGDAEQVAAELRALGRRAIAVAVDVTRGEQVQAMVRTAVAEFGGLDIAVNNAGVLGVGPIETITEAEWDRVLDVNLKGVFLCTQAEIAAMKSRGAGRIVNIASAAGKSGYPGLSHYCASKFAVVGFSNAVAKELATTGITVNTVCPGIIGTDMWIGGKGLANMFKQEGETRDQSFTRNVAAFVPQGVAQTAEDMGDAVVFLASAAHVTGQAINIDGGMNLY